MSSIPKDIDKWDNNKWTKQVINCRPSGGGAVGVIFVWAGMAYSRQNVQDPKHAAFVIKPIQGKATPTKFAEHILSKIGGALSPNSKPIPRRSYSGSGLVMTLKMFRDKETNPKTKERWKEVFQHYDRADAFLIQETQVGIQEFGDVAEEQSGLATMLCDKALMFNLGKLFAADALIGNGDRLTSMNTGNIVFKADKTICAIDSTTIMTDFNHILMNSKMQVEQGLDSSVTTATQWVKRDINFGYAPIMTPAQQRQDANYTNDPVNFKPVAMPPGAGLEVLYDINSWWDNTFMTAAKLHLQKNNLPSPPPIVWQQAKDWFKAGLEEGKMMINSRLSGINWLLIKRAYSNFVNRYGGDPNLDWTNFKIRRKYVKLRNKNLDHAQAMTVVQKYVARRMPGL